MQDANSHYVGGQAAFERIVAITIKWWLSHYMAGSWHPKDRALNHGDCSQGSDIINSWPMAPILLKVCGDLAWIRSLGIICLTTWSTFS